MSDTDLNRSLWDERALLHGQGGYYDVEGFRAGGSSLSEREIEEFAPRPRRSAPAAADDPGCRSART